MADHYLTLLSNVWYTSILEVVQLREIFGIIAGILAFAAYIWYCRAILRGTTRPNRMTWVTLAAVSWVLLSTYKAGGADTTIWLPLGEAIAVSVVALASLKRGVGGFERTDVICFLGVVGSFVLWQVFESSTLGLVASLSVDTFVLYPTVKKSFIDPSSEDRPAWTMTQVANVFNLLALDQVTFAVLSYPVWRFLLDGVVVYALYRSRKHLRGGTKAVSPA